MFFLILEHSAGHFWLISWSASKFPPLKTKPKLQLKPKVSPDSLLIVFQPNIQLNYFTRAFLLSAEPASASNILRCSQLIFQAILYQPFSWMGFFWYISWLNSRLNGFGVFFPPKEISLTMSINTNPILISWVLWSWLKSSQLELCSWNFQAVNPILELLTSS